MAKKNKDPRDELRELIAKRADLVKVKHLRAFDREYANSVASFKQAIARLEAELSD